MPNILSIFFYCVEPLQEGAAQHYMMAVAAASSVHAQLLLLHHALQLRLESLAAVAAFL
jgi:hypothetical protein